MRPGKKYRRSLLMIFSPKRKIEFDDKVDILATKYGASNKT